MFLKLVSGGWEGNIHRSIYRSCECTSTPYNQMHMCMWAVEYKNKHTKKPPTKTYP